MGMPCEINSILKLNSTQNYPNELDTSKEYQIIKEGYRIIPIDVPIPLVDRHWVARADIMIKKLTWEARQTIIDFQIVKVYSIPFAMKDDLKK
jgi:hypothetical protein